MRQRLLGVLVVSVGLSLSSGALAQAPKGDADTAWRAKFDAGREALRGKRVKEALALFQESWALNKTAGTMLNIGTCEEQLGQPASAWKHYKEALEMLPAKDERVPTVKQWVERVEPHVPRLRIRLDKGAPAGTESDAGGPSGGVGSDGYGRADGSGGVHDPGVGEGVRDADVRDQAGGWGEGGGGGDSGGARFATTHRRRGSQLFQWAAGDVREHSAACAADRGRGDVGGVAGDGGRAPCGDGREDSGATGVCCTKVR